MDFSTTTIATELPKQVALGLINAIDEGSKQFARTAWSFAISVLSEHWLLIMGIFAGLLLIFFLFALVGEWGSLYSLTYWTLYAVIVLIVGLIFGPETFVNDWYHPIYLMAI